MTVFAMTVFAGNSSSTGPWLCPSCSPKLGDTTVFDVVPVPLQKSGPPTTRVKRSSQKTEQRIADEIGGRPQPGSGNQPFAKGDVRKKGQHRIEVKDTYSKQYTMTLSTLDKIRSECSLGEQPSLVVTFKEKDTHRTKEAWVAIPYSVWLEKVINAPEKHL